MLNFYYSMYPLKPLLECTVPTHPSGRILHSTCAVTIPPQKGHTSLKHQTRSPCTAESRKPFGDYGMLFISPDFFELFESIWVARNMVSFSLGVSETAVL